MRSGGKRAMRCWWLLIDGVMIPSGSAGGERRRDDGGGRNSGGLTSRSSEHSSKRPKQGQDWAADGTSDRGWQNVMRDGRGRGGRERAGGGPCESSPHLLAHTPHREEREWAGWLDGCLGWTDAASRRANQGAARRAWVVASPRLAPASPFLTSPAAGLLVTRLGLCRSCGASRAVQYMRWPRPLRRRAGTGYVARPRRGGDLVSALTVVLGGHPLAGSRKLAIRGGTRACLACSHSRGQAVCTYPRRAAALLEVPARKQTNRGPAYEVNR